MTFRKLAKKALAATAIVLCMSPALAGIDDGVIFTPQIQTALYTSGNSIGGLMSVPLFRNSAISPSGVLTAILLLSRSGATTPITFYIFDTLPAATTCGDNTSFSMGGLDSPHLAVRPFTLTPAATLGTTISSDQLIQVSSIANQDIGSKKQFVYVCLVVGANVTPASTTDLIFKMSIVLD